MDRIARYLQDFQYLLDKLPVDKVDQIITILHEARYHGKQVIVIGTGSSAAIANQFVAALSRITRQSTGPGVKAICLTDQSLFLSKYSEDEEGAPVLLTQLDNLLERGDVFIAMSPQDHPRVAIRCIEIANRRGAITIGFTGESGSRLASLVDVCIQVPSPELEQIENAFQVLGNLIACVLRDEARSLPRDRIQELVPSSLTHTVSPMQTRRSPVDSSYNSRITERSRASLEMFSELSRELAYQMSLRDLLRRILELTLERLRASSGTIVVLNDRGDPVEGAVAYNGEVVPSLPQQYSEIVDRGLAGWVLKNRKGALINNTRDDPRWLARPWEDEGGNARSAICVPLMEEERVVGVMTLVARQVGVFSEEDLSLLAAVAMFITLVNYAL